MLFTSLTFFLFTPLVVAVSFALPFRMRWAWLLIASYAFYVSSAQSNVVYLAVVTLVAFACGQGIARSRSRRRQRLLLLAGLLSVLGTLFVFKYYDFLAGELESLLAGGDGPAEADVYYDDLYIGPGRP